MESSNVVGCRIADMAGNGSDTAVASGCTMRGGAAVIAEAEENRDRRTHWVAYVRWEKHGNVLKLDCLRELCGIAVEYGILAIWRVLTYVAECQKLYASHIRVD